MKRIIAFLCVISVLLVSMAGCKTKQEKPDVTDTTQVTTTSKAPADTTTTAPSATTASPATTTTAATTAETTGKKIVKATTKAKTVQTTTAVPPVTATTPPTTTAETPATTVTVASTETEATVSETSESVTESDTCTETSYTGQLLAGKPVTYLYPTEKTDVKVSLNFDGELTCTYPAYNDSWNVTAYPDGKLINKADGKEYSYLFWEGNSETKYDLSRGFVVKGSDTADFLQKKLAYLGLTPKEYNEFIVYWLPKMQDNPYNLITFQGDSYTDSAKLEITPKPDSMLRVFIVYKPLAQPVQIEEQELSPFERTGFSVIEWGGTSINN